jgi:hypothetical protein
MKLQRRRCFWLRMTPVLSRVLNCSLTAAERRSKLRAIVYRLGAHLQSVANEGNEPDSIRRRLCQPLSKPILSRIVARTTAHRKDSCIVIIFGASGDLTKRKLHGQTLKRA